MKKITFVLSLLLVLSIGESSAQKLKKIFNGKNLKGWTVPNPNNDNWTVADGQLIVKSSEDRKGSTLWTEKSYTDFVIEVEYKNTFGIVDSGIFLRSDKDQIQIGISGSRKKDLTGSPYIPGKSYPKVADISSVKPNDWNTMKIKVVGDNYIVWVNGTEVMNYTSEDIPATGPVGIQLHPGNEMGINYRSIKLSEI
ncbi:3-keto-disaccharide hydrolase [Arcticibacterium luteifluviistationis]|uniref:DUF1080 domain-containing protein n=1 Tax=Arcticibacterium luteifluviistationis TaxID=1784714 RepID=A0A2Z4G7C2_9BACT|nr:DUF1080 domain-containing protein [Arcticibacterium luteifluviistationis]AWV97071.1 DUF1080 domain-containing protein [Arcticibacterium luteifluviistationis]